MAADAGSVELLAKAGYDPMAAAHFWNQTLAEADATAAARNVKSRKGKNGGMFGTHPPSTERAVAIKALAVNAPGSGVALVNRAEYRAALAPLSTSLIDDQIKMNDFGATEFLIGFLANDGWTPDLYYARGELYRSRGRPEDITAAIGFYRQATSAAGAPIEAWRGALKDYLERKPDASDKAMIAMLAGV